MTDAERAAELLIALKVAEEYITHAYNWPLGTRIQKRPIALKITRDAIARAEGRDR